MTGNVAQRPIRSGSTFQSHCLQAPSLVERGQRVTVIGEGAGFRVSREGEGLEDGAQGETIRVRF
ncbi:flagellar basal body P-ring formation chaperone FlgA, partial [Halomonas sp. SIMBA_159]